MQYIVAFADSKVQGYAKDLNTAKTSYRLVAAKALLLSRDHWSVRRGVCEVCARQNCGLTIPCVMLMSLGCSWCDLMLRFCRLERLYLRPILALQQFDANLKLPDVVAG